MKSTTLLCILCIETVLALTLAVGAVQSYGRVVQSTCLKFRSSPMMLPCAVPSVRPMLSTDVRKITSTNSTAKGNNMDTNKYSNIHIAAATICAEAGGEPFAGQVMVGETIANRAINSGKSIRDVCLAPKQFSCWNNRGAMGLKMQTMRKHPSWNDCLMIAEGICRPAYTPVSPATHYYAPKRCKKPSWAKRMRLVAVFGNHRFYKERI